MNPKDYTADSICRAVGLGQFIDCTWSKTETAAIRIVGKPSFHPEVVITLTKIKSDVLISIVAAKSQFWSTYPQPIELFADQFSSDDLTFSQFFQQFDAASAEAKRPNKSICLDGMGIEACSVLNSKIERFEAHVAVNKSAYEFTARLVKYAWELCGIMEVKNGLSHVAGYVGLIFPELQLVNSPSKPRVRVLVLGTPEERN